MGKTIHVVSDAAGVILKASKDKGTCEAYIDGCLSSSHRQLEPVTTPSGDPATLYKLRATEDEHEWRTAYALTTLRLS